MRLVASIASVVVVVAAAAVLGLFLWLRSYDPLSATEGMVSPGPNLTADIQPTLGSGGREVFVPDPGRGKTFDASFTLANRGRFAVTVTGVEPDANDHVSVGRLLMPDGSALHPFTELRLDPHQSALVAAQWRLSCAHMASGSAATTWTLRLRYRYLSIFRRTAAVELPFAVTLRC